MGSLILTLANYSRQYSHAALASRIVFNSNIVTNMQALAPLSISIVRYRAMQSQTKGRMKEKGESQAPGVKRHTCGTSAWPDTLTLR